MSRPALPAASFSRRQWQRRLRRARPVLVTLAVVGVSVLAGWLLLGSSWLAAQQVTVEGERTLSDAQILAAADVELGTALVRLDLDAVDRRVSGLRPVAAASVHRAWPHTVAITVVERQPVAAIYRSGSWWVMDADGVLFRRTDGPAATLPVVEVRGSAVDRAALQEAASVIAALPRDLRARVQRLVTASMDSITLALHDGRRVRWGSAAETDQKVEVLSVLLRQPARVYDVSVPAQPTITK